MLWGYSALKGLKMNNCVYLVKLGFEGMIEGLNKGVVEGLKRALLGFVLSETPVFIGFLDFRGIEKRANLTVKGS